MERDGTTTIDQDRWTEAALVGEKGIAIGPLQLAALILGEGRRLDRGRRR